MNTPTSWRGKFWEIDADGFIVNEASPTKIQNIYENSIEAVVRAYRAHVTGSLHSVYLRGTVPRGMAVPGHSDLDTFALVSDNVTTGDLAWPISVETKIIGDCPHLTGVQFEIFSTSDAMTTNEVFEMPFVIKTQTVCVYGDDLSARLPNYRPDATFANIDIIQIKQDIDEAKAFVSAAMTDEHQIRYWCKRIMKNVVRTGFSLTIVNEKKYTRDLLPCVQIFARHFPDQAGKMQRALQYAVDPTVTPIDLMAFLNEFGGWLVDEANAWLDEHNPDRLSGMAQTKSTNFD